MAKRAVIRSFAKINLFLDIICKRRDGYHNIETIFQTISLSDTIELELASAGVDIQCNNPTVPTDESNLVYKSFLSLKEKSGYKGGIRVRIHKNIPPGAGLGGGSSNAAAALLLLNNLLGAGISDDRLREIGGEIGADVPFFISGGLAAAWQIGDRIMPLPPLSETFIMLAAPRDITVSTQAAYGMVSVPGCKGPMPENFSQCSDRLKACVEALESHRLLSMNPSLENVLHNSLEEPVFSCYPEIAEVKSLLLRAGAKGALMSGSGSAVFGLAESLEHAGEIKKAVETSGTCQCFIVRTVDRGSELKVRG